MLDQLPLIQLLNPAMSLGRYEQLLTHMLEAYVTNSAAHRFYFREGFHIKSYHFYKNL